MLTKRRVEVPRVGSAYKKLQSSYRAEQTRARRAGMLHSTHFGNRLPPMKPALSLLLLSVASLPLALPVSAQTGTQAWQGHWQWPGTERQQGAQLRLEQAEVLLQQSDVLLASVHAEGVLSRPCAVLEAPRVQRSGKVFRIVLRESAGRGEGFCQGLAGTHAPFYVSLPLEVRGLPSGIYRVEINELNLQFFIP